MNQSARARFRRGVTITELIVVLGVGGVLTSIAAPLASPTERAHADVSVREVLAGLGAAHRLAVLRQHDVVVTFLLAERALRVHRDGDNDGIVDAGEDVRLLQLPETVGFGLGSTPAIGADAGARALIVEPSTGEVRCFAYLAGAWEAVC